MTHWLNRPVLLVLLSTAFAGCKTDMGASYAELLRAIEPDASCLFAVTNPFSSVGFYDPRVNDGEGYKLTYLVKNNLAKAADDTVALGELSNVHGTVNDLRVDGFEGCWYIASDANFIAAQDPNGLIDCDTIPTQSDFFVAPQTTLEGGDVTAVSVTVLNLDHMRSLFGTGFNPDLIPNEGVMRTLHDTSDNTIFSDSYSLDTESPADPKTRNANWGERYPVQRDVPVNVQLRAKLRTQSGSAVHTNWMTFPITVRPGGLGNSCGMLTKKICQRGPCQNGDACLVTGQCADGGQCSNAELFSGLAAAFDFSGACLPAQNYFATQKLCGPVGCDATK